MKVTVIGTVPLGCSGMAWLRKCLWQIRGSILFLEYTNGHCAADHISWVPALNHMPGGLVLDQARNNDTLHS